MTIHFKNAHYYVARKNFSPTCSLNASSQLEVLESRLDYDDEYEWSIVIYHLIPRLCARHIRKKFIELYEELEGMVDLSIFKVNARITKVKYFTITWRYPLDNSSFHFLTARCSSCDSIIFDDRCGNMACTRGETFSEYIPRSPRKKRRLLNGENNDASAETTPDGHAVLTHSGGIPLSADERAGPEAANVVRIDQLQFECDDGTGA